MSSYQPPVNLTPKMFDLVASISELVGRLTALSDTHLTPQLRRGNRIRTIQASLAIENNTLSVDQVTAVLAGQRVLGLPREIQEVRNAFATYEAMQSWQMDSRRDLLAAHGLLMQGLLDDAGRFRSGGVGIYRGEQLLHMAPPPSRVSTLMDDLLGWLASTELHPLIASCVFHYEFEFIHPFADGNGRMGRLWQTLILSRWRPVLAYLPVETVIRDQQQAYYAALAAADAQSETTLFIEFMLLALHESLQEAVASVQVGDQVSDQVARLLQVIKPGETLKASELMQRLDLHHRPTFSNNYLKPAVQAGVIEMTDPGSPRSPRQRYRRRP